MDDKKRTTLFRMCQAKEAIDPDLLQEYYDHRYEHFCSLTEQDLSILAYMLRHPNENQEDLLDCLKYFQERICFGLTRLDEVTEQDVKQICFQLNGYEFISQVLDELDLASLSETMQRSIQNYRTSTIDFFYVDVLMNYLQDHFLDLEGEEVVKIFYFITNNKKFQTSLVSSKKLNYRQKRMFKRYINDVLPIIEFVSENYIQSDIFIQHLLKFDIQDYEILQYLLNNLSCKRVMHIFCDAQSFLSFCAEAPYLRESQREKLVSLFLQKFLDNEECWCLMPLYKEENSFPVFQELLDAYQEDVLQTFVKSGQYGSDDIPYLSKTNIDEPFVSNAMFLTRDYTVMKRFVDKGFVTQEMYETKIQEKDSLQEKVRKCSDYNRTGRVLSYSIAKELLQAAFLNEDELTEDALQAIIRAILMNFTTDLDAVVFMDASCLGKIIHDKEIIIGIRRDSLQTFLDPLKTWEERIEVFKTLFHEYRHYLQPFSEAMKKDFAMLFYMESILWRYDCDFYEKNYSSLHTELDANRFANLYTWRFLRQFTLPFDISFLLEEPKIRPYPAYQVASSLRPVDLISAFQRLLDFHFELAKDYEKRFGTIKENIVKR